MPNLPLKLAAMALDPAHHRRVRASRTESGELRIEDEARGDDESSERVWQGRTSDWDLALRQAAQGQS